MDSTSARTSAAGAMSFRGLLHPLTEEAFFNQLFGRRVTHIAGDPEKLASVFSWDEFNRLLNASLWSEQTLKLVLDSREVAPESYSRPGTTREGHRALLPDPAKVEALLRRGATLILDHAQTLTPEIADVSRALASATGGAVICNVYCSFRAHQGFPAHFDTTDVFALQIAGKKVWRIYEGVAKHPVDLPGYNYSSAPRETHDSAKGRVAMEVEMTPGDVLYLPRGHYHEALASTDASLHLSFGTARPSGLDFLAALSRWIAEDARFRESLPHYDLTDRYQAHLRGLGEALLDHAGSADTARRMRDWQLARVFRDGGQAFELPRVGGSARYRVRRRGVSLDTRQSGATLTAARGEVELTPAETAMTVSLLSGDFTGPDLLAAASPGAGTGEVETLLKKLAEAGAIEPV